MATFKDMLVEARNLLVNNAAVTATVDAAKITFGAKPQMPATIKSGRIAFEYKAQQRIYSLTTHAASTSALSVAS